MSGYPRNVRQPWAKDAKPDGTIVGRADMKPARQADGQAVIARR
jgi:hypothetical protein